VAFGNLTNLKILLLQNNRFVGEIPEMTLPHVREFNVSFNHVNRSIPVELWSQLRSAFLGTGLCSGPLGACPGET
jgi:hypothetical protein